MASGEVLWQHDFKEDVGHATFHGDPLLTDELVITGTEGLTPVHTRAFDLRTGRTAWQREGEDALTRSDIVGLGRLAIGRNDEGALVALDAASGATVWRFDHRGRRYRPDIAESPAVVGGDLVFSAPDGALYRVTEDGNEVWRREIGCDASTAVAAAEDDVWIGCSGGTLVRLGAAAGRIRARLDLDRSVEGRLTVVDDLLVVPGGSGWIGAVSRDLEGLVWERTDLPRLSVVQPILWMDRLLTGAAEGELLALDPEDGRTLWQIQLEGSLRGLGAAGNILLVGTTQGKVTALRLRD